MLSLIDAYFSFVRNAFLKMLAYRLRYYTGIFTYLFFVAVYYFIWEAVYHNKPDGATINGYTLQQMLTYVTVGWIARSFYFTNTDDEIDDLVRTGQISIYLLRPVNFQLMMLAQAVGESSFRVLFFSLPIGLVIIWLFPVLPPAGWSNFGLFCLATTFGFLIMACINFAVGLLAFKLKSIDGIMRAKYNLVQLASGLILPFTFLPGWLESLFNFLPFKAMAYTPLNFYLGKVADDQVLGVLLEQMAWLAALATLGLFMWRSAAAKLTLQGG